MNSLALRATAAALSVSLASPLLADQARVRVIHASPDAPAVDVLVDGAAAFTDLAFGESSAYAALPAATYGVEVVPAGLAEPVVIDAELALAAGTDYTVIAVDELAAIEPLVLVDDNALDAKNARIRFVHASPDAPAVDIALANGGPVLFGNVLFKEARGAIAVPPGTYDLEARLAGTSTVVLPIPGVTLDASTVYTALAIGFAGGGEPALQASLAIDARATSRVRVFHGSPDAPAVDVLVNDAIAFSGVAFESATAYAELPFGTYNVKVVPAGLAAPVVIEADLDLLPGATITVAAVNELASIAPLVLTDRTNVAPDQAAVRFVHASPDAPAVDVALAGGAVLFGNVAFAEVGDFLTVPAGTYDLEVRLAGTETVVLPLPGILLEADSISTAWATGLVGGTPALSAALTRDALICRGDVTTDATIDTHDLVMLLADWGPCTECATDLDADGDVGFGDLLRLLGGWGPCP